MTATQIRFVLRVVMALLVGTNVILGVMTGSPMSWGAAAFIAILALTGDWS